MRVKQVFKAVVFEAIREASDPFLSLFPHRFDYIYAKHTNPGEKPLWQTESRHPLSDRLIEQGAFLYGVRFGSQTNYCLLDIDAGSAYHPRQDELAIARITASLEKLGLVAPVICTSSYSGGLHLYFPFQQQQNSWAIASTVATLLENAGFLLKPGQLEVFPNPKPYFVETQPSLFNAHRLPIQAGSYLLNAEFQRIWSDRTTFVQQWQFAQAQNEVNAQTLRQILAQAKRKVNRVSGKADKFINDLNAEIEMGWTDYGQTNRLLGRITMRTYIFHHLLTGESPLSGEDLVNQVVAIAQSLPGYQNWCRHQHEIYQRAEDWVRCIENSHYFQYGSARGKFQAKTEPAGSQNPDLVEAVETVPNWNQQQQDGARERIRGAIANLLENNALPTQATARFKALLSYGIGGASLYRHRDLWHPTDLAQSVDTIFEKAVEIPEEAVETVENPPHPPTLLEGWERESESIASHSHTFTSLFPVNGGNDLQEKRSEVSQQNNTNTSGSNSVMLVEEAVAIALHTELNLKQICNGFAVAPEQERQFPTPQHSQTRQQMQQESYQRQLQNYLESDDPILVAEAYQRIKPLSP